MNSLSQKIILLVEQAQSFVSRVTNTAIVSTNFRIGQMIVEEYQQGDNKASYGKSVLKSLSSQLTDKLGKGYSVDNLENMRNLQFSIYLFREQFSDFVSTTNFRDNFSEIRNTSFVLESLCIAF